MTADWLNPLGSSAGSVLLFGDDGKLHVVAGRHCWNLGCVRYWRVTPPAVVLVPGISYKRKPCRLNSPMPAYNRLVFPPSSASESVTSRTAGMRTRMSGGVAEVGE